MKLRDVFKSGDQTVWCFLCSQTTVNEGAEVSRSGLLCVTRGTQTALSTSLSFLSLATKLLRQLLEVSVDFGGSRSSPLISLQMLSFAVTVKTAHC